MRTAFLCLLLAAPNRESLDARDEVPPHLGRWERNGQQFELVRETWRLRLRDVTTHDYAATVFVERDGSLSVQFDNPIWYGRYVVRDGKLVGWWSSVADMTSATESCDPHCETWGHVR